MTDAFLKYMELVVAPSNDSRVITKAIFGCPLDIVTDQGKEFGAKLSNELFELLKIRHATTSLYHPQCNSQAKIANKAIVKYLACIMDESMLDWEDYTGLLMFTYNTSCHRSIKTTPFFLTHGMEAKQSGFEAADIQNKFDGPQSPDQEAREIARPPQLHQRPTWATCKLVPWQEKCQTLHKVHWPSPNPRTQKRNGHGQQNA